MEVIPKTLVQIAIWIVLSAIVLASGCKLGRNDPEIQTAFEMLRIERDAAEDQYYEVKQKHERAEWQIEDLETQLKQVRENRTSTNLDADGLDTNDLEELSGANASNQYRQRSATQFGENQYPADQISTSVSFVDSEQDTTVSSIEIDTNLTQGYHDDGTSGDDGVAIAFRTLNDLGKAIPGRGQVTISLIDPARRGIRGRVGAWVIEPEDVVEWYDQKSNVFMFRLPWLRGVPKNSELKVFVKFDDGQFSHETSEDLHVVLDGKPKSRWTKVPTGSTIADNTSPNLNNPRIEIVNTNLTNQNSDSKSLETIEKQNGERIARPQWTPYR